MTRNRSGFYRFALLALVNVMLGLVFYLVTDDPLALLLAAFLCLVACYATIRDRLRKNSDESGEISR